MKKTLIKPVKRDASSVFGEESEEDDYMAMAVPEPSVIPQTYTHHRLKQLKRSEEKGRIISPKVTELERREEGLETELDSSNKGFKMLAKMGFKPSDDSAKPISVTLKSDKKGLGVQVNEIATRVSTKHEKKAKDDEFIRKKDGFRVAQSGNFDVRLAMKDVSKARKACQDLDEKHDRERTEFWPVRPQLLQLDDGQTRVIEDEGEFEMLDPGVQLVAVNDYLRNEYFYCIWCGEVYDDAEMLASECPGEARADHDDDN
jgi:Domain of unknown function (DUF4187)